MMKCNFFAIIFFILITRGATKLNKGKYDGLKVFINPDVDVAKNEQESFITSLKNLLTEGSSALYASSHDRVSLGNIEIIIPEDWNVKGSSVVGMTYLKPDIEVSIVGLGGKAPYTVQGGQCGGPGLKISISKDYVIEQSIQATYGSAGKFLAKELLKMRYGVYDEFGLSTTSLSSVNFFDWVLVNERATSCNDPETLQGDYKNEEGDRCEPDKYDTDCRLEVSASAVDYSTLYVTHIDKVTRACNETTHDYSPPTTHNLVCTRSVLSVMLDHPDFQGSTNSTEDVNRAVDVPTFAIKQLTYLPTMFILDINGATDEIIENDMEIILRKIIRSFQLILERKNIPEFGFAYIDGTESDYAINYFNKKPFTEIDQISAMDLLEFFPLSPTDKEFAPIGGSISKVVNEIEKDRQGNDISILVIELSKTNDMVPDLQDLQNEYFISSVLYGNDSKNIWLKDFTEQYEGNYYNSIIYDGRAAVSSILNMASDTEIITHFQERITTNDSYKIDVYIDGSAGINTVFEATMEDGLLQGAILLNPDGEIVSQSPVNSEEIPSGGIGQSIYFISDATEGWWSYILVMGVLERNNVFWSSVTSEQREDEDSVTAELWTSATSSVHELSESPLALFVSLMKGSNPVAGAEVFLRISVEDLDGGVLVVLFDDGNYAPDLSQNDGIYSGYLNDTSELFSDGDVEISVDIIASSANPQHDLTPVLRENTATPHYYDPMPYAVTMALTRQILSRYSLTLTGVSQYDPPPSKIFDFHIVGKTNGEGKTTDINLAWTAPGENFTEGKVSSYDLRVITGDSFTEDFEQWTPIEGLNIDILPAGFVQFATVNLERNFKKQFLAIRGVDKSGNTGPVSPIKAITPLVQPDSFVGSAAFVFLIIFCVLAVVAGIGGAAYYSFQSGGNPVSDLMSRFKRDG